MTRSSRGRKKAQPQQHQTTSLPSLNSSEDFEPDRLIIHEEDLLRIVRNELAEVKAFFKIELSKQLELLKEEVNSLKSELRQKDDDIVHLERQLYDSLQYNRRNNLEFAGINDEIVNENLEKAVIKVCSEIGVEIKPNDISACHRLPKPKEGNGTNLPKRTIVRFVNRKSAENVKKNSGNLKGKPENSMLVEGTIINKGKIYINENLCRPYRDIWGKCRKLHKEKKINKYSTVNGVVTIRIIESGPWMKIKHVVDLFSIFPDFFLDEKSSLPPSEN